MEWAPRKEALSSPIPSCQPFGYPNSLNSLLNTVVINPSGDKVKRYFLFFSSTLRPDDRRAV